MKRKDPRIVRFPNTDEGAKNYLFALSLMLTMPHGVNRVVKKSHTKVMAQSVREYGITRTIIAINTNCFNGEQNAYIGDGQHLIEAILTRLKPSEITGNLSIAYYDMNDRSEIIPFISRLNSTSKTWNIKEFLSSWASHGLETYQFLLAVHDRTKHSISKLIEIYTFKRASESTSAFRLGQLKINKQLGNYVLATYNNAVAVGLYKSNSAFLAFTRIMVDYKILDPTEILHIIVEEESFSKKLSRDEYLWWFRLKLNDDKGQAPSKLNKKPKIFA